MYAHTLIAVLRRVIGAEDTGITFIEGNSSEEFLSYKDLYTKALQVLHVFQMRGLRPGSEVVFQIEDNRKFIVSIWACILGGLIPVPISIGQNDEHKHKLFNIWDVLEQPFLIGSEDTLLRLQLFARANNLDNVFDELESNFLSDKELFTVSIEGEIHDCSESDIALIQFSSGSTGTPKGVVLTHRNLIINMQSITDASCYTADDSMISWMPLTHDMGLIGFHLNPLFCGINQYLIPTSLFIRNPSLWLEKASEHKVTILCSPNFGYKYVMKHTNASNRINLNAVRIMYNGAEPIAPQLCRAFMDCYMPFGLRKESICPVYGLAEASLAVSISSISKEMETIEVDRKKLNIGDAISVCDSEQSISFANVGNVIQNCTIRITYGGRQCPEGTVGHIEIKGANVTEGYYKDRQRTSEILDGNGWLNTGDLGFMMNQSLYVTGRAKDIIFVNGLNYYPHDLERIAEQLPGIELNKVAIGGFLSEAASQEEVVAFVLHRGPLDNFSTMAFALKKLINEKVGVEVHEVIPVKEMPKTTSGKLQRFKLLEMYRSGTFDQVLALVKKSSKAVEPSLNETILGDLEINILAIWQDVLGNVTGDITERFYEAGGNSLKAAELEMRVFKKFGVRLPLSMLTDGLTIKSLAEVIRTTKSSSYISIPKVTTQGLHPVTSAQKRLYFAWAADKYSTHYNIPTALRIAGQLDTGRLGVCIRRIIERHDSLRMSFHLVNDEPGFHIENDTAGKFKLSEVLLNRELNLNESIRNLIHPFNLGQAPLFKFQILKRSKDESFLFMDFHHIICDGLSIYSIVDEIVRAYHEEPLPELVGQFTDYSYWENQNLWDGELRKEQEYWAGQFKNEIPTLQLPTDFSRPKIFDTVGKRLDFEFSKDLVDDLKVFAIAQKCSLHTLLFTVYNVLLSRYCGQDQLLIGIPVAGRPHPDLKHVVGMFVNNLPIWTSIKEEWSFVQLIASVKIKLDNAISNQRYPFEKLLSFTGKRDFSRNPIFDTMFLFQDMDTSAWMGPRLSLSRHFFDPGFSKFDMSFHLVEDGGRMWCGIEYATSLFDEVTVRNMGRHFCNLLSALIKDPDRPLAEINTLDQVEIERRIIDFNDTAVSLVDAKLVHQRFESWAQMSPERTAIEFQGEVFSYGRINHSADVLAANLHKNGVKPNSIIAISLPNTPELIISILAVLKAGGCYLPVDPELPAGRVRHILDDSKALLVISHSAQWTSNELRNGLDLSKIMVDEVDLSAATAVEVRGENVPSDLAYIIYTSGSTGNPKGVMIEHSALCNYVDWAVKLYVGDRVSAFPLFTSISFDLTVTSIFTPLVTGNKIVIYQGTKTMSALEGVLSDNRTNVIKLTPSHVRLLVQLTSAYPDCRKLDRFIIGGEQLESSVAADIVDLFGEDVEIYNEYGPTEATVGCMIHKFNPSDQRISVPIGVPAANTQIYLLDKHMRPVPNGVSADLFISGKGLSRGYLNNEELTRQRFIKNPFIVGRRMYRSDDVARMNNDNVLEFVGRSDDQVKINGYRVEVSEVIARIKSYSGVVECAVLVGETEEGQKYLMAYFVGEYAISEFGLKQTLSEELPYYMIPSRFIQVGQIPLTSNGKVDFERLSADDIPVMVSPATISSPIHEIFKEIWVEILGLQDLSVNDNFFELGGDSIKAVQIVSRLNERGMTLSVNDVLVYGTIDQLSQRVKVKGNHNFAPDPVSGDVPHSPITTWFFSQKFVNPNFYNQSVLLELQTKVDVSILHQTFTELIQLHDSLRLNYSAPRNTLFFNHAHLKGFRIFEFEVGEGQIEDDVVRIAQQVKGTFDITNSLLIKAVIIRIPSGPELLLITAHHLVIDGISWRILLDDLYRIYKGRLNGQKKKGLHKTASLLEWTKASILRNHEGLVAEQEDLRNGEDFCIPLDFETHDWKVGNTLRYVANLDRSNTIFLLKEALANYRTGVLTILNTALAATIHKWTGSTQITIDQESHGRHFGEVDLSRTIGWFTHMFPLHLDLKGLITLEQCISMVTDKINLLLPHVSRGDGQSDVHLAESSKHYKQTSEVRLNYLGQFSHELNNDLFRLSDIAHGNESDGSNNMTARLDLNLMVIDQELKIEITYNRKAHSENTIRWIMDTFIESIVQILDHLRESHNIYFSPSDFSAPNLSREELDSLFS